MLRIAIYGGTFDPVHKGHVATALTLEKIFQFNALFFLPCKDPVLKASAKATAEHRVEMLKLVLQTHTAFDIDLREIQRETPSRMVETLESFRRDTPDASITLILGMDAFLSLPQWYQWERLLQLAHLLVMKRPGYAPLYPLPLQTLLAENETHDLQDLKNNEYGNILIMDAGYFDISSTDIREHIKNNLATDFLLDKKVQAYIEKNKLYQS